MFLLLRNRYRGLFVTAGLLLDSFPDLRLRLDFELATFSGREVVPNFVGFRYQYIVGLVEFFTWRWVNQLIPCRTACLILNSLL